MRLQPPSVQAWLGLFVAAAPLVAHAQAQRAVRVPDPDDLIVAATAKRTHAPRRAIARSLDDEPLVKIHPTLRHAAGAIKRFGVVAANRRVPSVSLTFDRRLSVDLRLGRIDDETLGQLVGLGFEVTHASDRWSRVSGTVPVDRLEAVAALPGVRRVKPYYPPITRAGAVLSQGDAAVAADVARTAFAVTGDGVSIGVLSDSCAVLSGGITGGTTLGALISGGAIGDTSSQLSGDLPASITNIQDIAPAGPLGATATDEGRAMLEIIHDLAPGATLYFATAFGSEAGFADNIVALAQAGCRVICDDVMYLDEPMFQDGIVAQAVDQVVATYGVTYFSAAGNAADDSYESLYRDAGATDTADAPPADFDDFHDFDPGADVDTSLQVTISAGGYVYVVLQWNEPFSGSLGAGASNDFDLYVLSADGSTLSLAESSYSDSIGDDPVEIVLVDNTFSGTSRTFCLGIDHYTGSGDTVWLKLAFFGSGYTIDEHQTNSPTIYGHAAADGAMAVAAEFYGEVNDGNVTDPGGVENVEPFSSLGPTTIYFNPTGALLGSPVARAKPDITAPDGANTTFFGTDIGFDADGHPNFFGTSAAAPHAAAVAALLIEYLTDRGRSLSPADIYDRLKSSAVDIEDEGVDDLSGAGRVDAFALLAAENSGDFDGDADVDLTDFSFFQNCYAGPAVPVGTGCAAADLDGDGDADITDFAVFAANYTGSL